MVTSRHFELSTTKERIVLRYGHNELCHYMVEIILENPNCNFCNLFCLFLIAKMQRFIFMTFAE